ncbi:hypothetical protein M422DRAFT_270637 [Sphaerobolus stellatus SS14]|uniref:F-box domain-containing protein n=1 Tax=Sphaerobolus stellatus (strain SS14) TaxID=990650 RepID=A0A0C9UGM2_SPHS4|nr:hypothetical protein M422DRAFT_270637 [Sphaerobolus stellatus SS14]
MHNGKIPAELFEYIVQLVDDLDDLLALSLVSKRHAEVALRYSHYRHIRCDIARVKLWEELSKTPTFARQVHRLELVAENSAIISSVLVPQPFREESTPIFAQFQGETDPHRYKEKYQKLIDSFLPALKEMSNLRSLYWIPRAEVANMHFVGLVYDTVAECCPNLRQTHSLFEEPCQSSTTCRAGLQCDYQIRKRLDCPFMNLSSISLILQGRHGNNGWSSFFSVLTLNNPSLQSLHLECISSRHSMTGTPDVSVILSYSHWLQLVRLSIKGHIRLYPDNMDIGQRQRLLGEFLVRHPKLQYLRLRSDVRSYIQSQEHPDGIANLPGLPRLLSLDVHGDFRLEGIPLCMMSRSLEYLMLGAEYPPNDSFAQQRILVILKYTAFSSLRTLVVPPESLTLLEGLPVVCPLLERFSFIYSQTHFLRIPLNLAKSRSTALSKLKKLTHLGGFFVYINLQCHPTFAKLLQKLATSTELKFIEIFDKMKNCAQWMEIERDEEGHYSGWSCTNARIDLYYETWGNILPGTGVMLPHRNQLCFARM